MNSKIEKKALVDELLNLKKILNYQDMADMLLVLMHKKPVAMIELSYFKNNSFSRSDFRDAVLVLKNILNRMNLTYQLHTNYPESKSAKTTFSLIANNSRTINLLRVANNKKNTQQRRMAVGALLGYPKTAIKAFAHNQSILIDDLPKRVQNKKALHFLNFRLSQNWKDELKYVRQRALNIKKISQKLYKIILK